MTTLKDKFARKLEKACKKARAEGYRAGYDRGWIEALEIDRRFWKGVLFGDNNPSDI